jgi:hypothetical protein
VTKLGANVTLRCAAKIEKNFDSRARKGKRKEKLYEPRAESGPNSPSEKMRHGVTFFD